MTRHHRTARRHRWRAHPHSSHRQASARKAFFLCRRHRSRCLCCRHQCCLWCSGACCRVVLAQCSLRCLARRARRQCCGVAASCARLRLACRVPSRQPAGCRRCFRRCRRRRCRCRQRCQRRCLPRSHSSAQLRRRAAPNRSAPRYLRTTRAARRLSRRTTRGWLPAGRRRPHVVLRPRRACYLRRHGRQQEPCSAVKCGWHRI